MFNHLKPKAPKGDWIRQVLFDLDSGRTTCTVCFGTHANSQHPEVLTIKHVTTVIIKGEINSKNDRGTNAMCNNIKWTTNISVGPLF